MIMVINIAFTDLLNGLFSASFNAANLFKEDYPMPEPQVSWSFEVAVLMSRTTTWF